MRTMEFKDLKDMLKQTGEKYGDKKAYLLQEKSGIREITHKQFREEINYLGTAMIEMGLKGKKIAVIGENRYEWELAYLAIATGVGVVVPLDKALPENEIESLILRSEVEAIVYSNKYDEAMANIQKKGDSKLKYFISMDLEKHEFDKYSLKEILEKGKELVDSGNKEFIDAKINNEEMGIMLFTSGTTNKSKAVMLSHKNICTNIMDIQESFELTDEDILLSFLPLHHTFECTVGFLYPISIGASIVFSKGVRHIADELKTFGITAMICVPVVYEKMYGKLLKGIKDKGKDGTVKTAVKMSNILSKVGIDVRKRLFKDIHQNLGGKIKVMVAGGAALSPEVEKGFFDLGFNLLQGYGLTETSPVIAAELTNQRKIGSIGKKLPSVEVKLDEVDEKTGVGELLVKGNSVMLGYFGDDEANKEAFTEDGWLHTGDYAKIDKDGYIFISGRKKFVIVLSNGKNVYPEELETLLNNSPLVAESMVYGAEDFKDKDITVSVKVVYDKNYIQEKYGNLTEDEIKELIWKEVKVVNRTMPKYKWIKNLLITDEEFEKTTTHKIKRKVEMEKILQG